MMTTTEVAEHLRRPWLHALPDSIWVAGITSPKLTGDDILIRRLPEADDVHELWAVINTELPEDFGGVVATSDIDNATEAVLVYADNPHQAVYSRDQHIVDRALEPTEEVAS